MAVLVSLIVLLGSLSVQGVMLQSQMSDSIFLMSRVREDAIVSSAQVVAGTLQQKCACLLQESWQQWDKNQACCGNGDLAKELPPLLTLLSGSMAGGSYQVIDYSFTKNSSSPELSTADLALTWHPESSDKKIQKTFRLNLDLSVDPPQFRGGLQ